MSETINIPWGRIVLIALLAVVAIYALGAAAWGANYGWRWVTAEPKGRLEAREEIESGTNRIQSQEFFETVYADVAAYDKQINQTADALADAEARANQTDAAFQRRVLTGLKNQCVDAVAQYNAEARKVSAEQFRSIDLPPEVPTTPAYDCKEN